MAYRFKLDEPFAAGFRRIARAQLDRTLAEVGEITSNPSSVHESRKALKRLRALLRLVAPAIGDKAFKRRNSALRRIARMLSISRDAEVLATTFDGLRGADERADAHLRAAREHVLAHTHQAQAAPTAETADQVTVLIAKEVKQFARLGLKGHEFAAIERGLEISYRTARRALQRVDTKPSDDNFHELRKAVQWHWRHMSLLSRAWPDAFAVRVAASRELSQMLGDDHDLAMVHQAAMHARDISDDARATLTSICRARQAAIRAAVQPRAARLFAENARPFARRIGSYWQHGRHVTPWPELPSGGLDGQETASVPTLAAPIKAAAPMVETGSATLIAAKTPGRSQSQRRV